MATSQNGWTVIPRGTDPRLVAIPKIIGRVRKGDVATIFTYLVNEFDRLVEDVDQGRDDWGYAYRSIRGKTSGYSNHASGTAIDLNATKHVLGRVNTFSPTQRTAIRAILKRLGGVVRWGGDYAGRKDEMHWEINASAARVAAVAAGLSGAKPVDNPKPTPAPAVGRTRRPRGLPPVLKKGSKGGWVGLWQSILRTQGERVVVDEHFGQATHDATRRVQRKWGLSDDAHVGPRTWIRALFSDRSGSLARNDNGPQVELWQNILGVGLDRNFGPGTESATKEVQRFLGLRDDGAAGPAMHTALRKFYKV